MKKECVPGLENIYVPPDPSTLDSVNILQHCRICLDECRQKPYCRCDGDLKVHSECLLAFLIKKSIDPKKAFCELCDEPFRLELKTNWRLSCGHACQKIRSTKGKCACYAVVCILLMAYLCFFAYLMVKLDTVTDSLVRTITTVLAVCACIVLMAIIILWINDYLLATRMPVRVVPTDYVIGRKCRRRQTVLMTEDHTLNAI